MIKHRFALVLALAATLSVSAAARAEAPQKSVFNFRGLTGQAAFSAFDGCHLTSLQVIGNQNVSHTIGDKPVTTDFATVIFIFFDVCTGDFRIGTGSGEASVNGSLQGLTINGTIPFNDTLLGQTTASVNVTLTATGEVTHDVENFHITGGGTTVAVRSVGSSTSATASGSVVVGGANLAAGLGTGTGAISDTNGGTVTIFH